MIPNRATNANGHPANSEATEQTQGRLLPRPTDDSSSLVLKAMPEQREPHPLPTERNHKPKNGVARLPDSSQPPPLPPHLPKTSKPSKQARHRPYTPRPIYGPNGPKLKQTHYFTFKPTLLVFHFAAFFLSVHAFRRLLTRRDHGYVETLLGTDPQRGRYLSEGDEVPEGSVEAVYLPNAFNRGGSALAFRTGVLHGVDQVEWFCFDKPFEKRILFDMGIGAGNAGLLFHHVATLDKETAKPRKPKSREDGYRGEYVGWYESLRMAEHRPRMISFAWSGFGGDLRAYWTEKQGQAREYAAWQAAKARLSGPSQERGPELDGTMACMRIEGGIAADGGMVDQESSPE